MPSPPSLLRSLDNVLASDGGYVADCPICRELITVDPSPDGWVLACDGGCTTQEILRWCGSSLNDTRLWKAVVLAPSLEVCVALLKGQHVPVSRLDPVWVRRLGVNGL